MSNYAIQEGSSSNLSLTYNSLTELFLHNTKMHSQQGMTIVDITGKEDFLSYADLAQKALIYLHGLQQKGFKSGDTLILIINNNLEDFYIAFWACIMAGIVVVPVSQPSFAQDSVTLLKLQNIWLLLKKPVLVIEDKYQKYYQNLTDKADFQDLQFFPVEELKLGTQEGIIYEAQPEELAILQFSSGSTGIPKGVQLTHRNILTNIFAIQKGYELTKDDKVFNWLPHTHDMGLFFQYLSPFTTGCAMYVFAPMVFTRSPYLFLKKITEHKGSWFGSPNFGLDWMVKNISDEQLSTLDLSSLRFVLNGAEPISARVMNDFAQKFAGCGFNKKSLRAAYGMAEATVCATVTPAFQIPKIDKVNRLKLINEQRAVSDEFDQEDTVDFVHVGYPIDAVSVRIADKEGNTLLEDQVGEIQIKGDSVTRGYIYKDDLSEQLFVGEWLHTGDLGYIRDGSLVIIGRIKDLIIVRGQNYFAHDLEEIIFNNGLVQRGNLLIIGSFNPQTQQEELLVFVKHKMGMEKFLSLRDQIMIRLHSELGLDVTHVLPVKSIPKTTSGKLQRFALLKGYQNGEYTQNIAEIKQYIESNQDNIRDERHSDTELEHALLRIWSNILGIPEQNISNDATFFSLGGNSLKAFQFLDELSRYLNKDIDPELLFICHTIRKIINYIQSEHMSDAASDRSSSVKSDEPDLDTRIAITGMALKFPGATTQQAFWDNLVQSKDAVTQISDARKKLAGAPHWDEWLAELESIDCFDNEFFDISPEEAVFMDPQQRLVMETSYHALEDAGVIPNVDDERNIGVYSGVSMNTYYQLLVQRLQDRERIHPHALVGNLCNLIAARLSRTYNFTGPALNIDTACSSFLVALHHAVTALRQNAIEGAVVVGANILVTPEVHLLSRAAGILSSRESAKVFDNEADGTVLGEGVVVFYLERLSTALTNNKNIYGVIRGTAINNDGCSFGVMAPSPKGQYQVLTEAYKNAKMPPSEISYLEVHGTGTTIGDLIEVNALNKLFSQYHKKDSSSVGLGSVKTNIGHLLPAASGAGLAKILLCLKNQKLVPNLHLNQVNKDLKLDQSPFYVVSEVVPWKVSSGISRKAGLSSFGLGGTNAHIVVEEWVKETKKSVEQSNHLLTISAKTEKALNIIMKNTLALLDNNSDLAMNDLCFTRNRYRAHYSYRAAFLIANTHIKVLGHLNKSPCMVKPEIGVVIGDLLSFETQAPVSLELIHKQIDLLSYWYSVFKNVLQHSKNIAFISGMNSGVFLADLLNGTTELDQAASLYKDYLTQYSPLKIREQDGCKSKFDALESNIVICLGHFKSHDWCGQAQLIHLESNTDLSPHAQRLSLMGELYIVGADLEWGALHSDGTGSLINLPSYPFDSKSFWIE